MHPLLSIAWSQQTKPSTPTTMDTSKSYIGKGKAIGTFGSVRVSLKMEDVLKHAYKTERGEFITFMVTPMKETDQYGKTHTVYVEVREPADATAVAEPAPEGGNTADGVATPKRKLRKK